jgi:hypothetical protein
MVLHSKNILKENMQKRQKESACDFATVQEICLKDLESQDRYFRIDSHAFGTGIWKPGDMNYGY